MYGRWKAVLAPRTANLFWQSRLKNHTPGRTPSVTYVRTFSSRKSAVPGIGGKPLAWTPAILNGTMPSHALPSKVCNFKPAGISPSSIAAGTHQCRNARLSHVMPITDERVVTIGSRPLMKSA